MQKFHQIFWVLLPTTIYGLFWAFWSSVLHKPVPVVGKFIWQNELALKKLLPNLPNPQDQFIYFPEASRWWDVALAPIGALVLVILFYNKKFNDESFAYEDVNFSWSKFIRDITDPFLKPYYAWKERRSQAAVLRHMEEARQVLDKTAINDVDAQLLDRSFNLVSGELQKINQRIEEENIRMFYPRMEGIKTMMVYCFTICLFFGTFFGILLGPFKGPFGFFGVQTFMGCLVGPLMLLSRRIQIAVMTHIAAWIGLWYGFSIGIGMIPAIMWTSYMFVPTGLVIVFTHYFRSRRRSKDVPALP